MINKKAKYCEHADIKGGETFPNMTGLKSRAKQIAQVRAISPEKSKMVSKLLSKRHK